MKSLSLDGILRKTVPQDNCLLWIGTKFKTGYGSIKVAGQTELDTDSQGGRGYCRNHQPTNYGPWISWPGIDR